MDVRLLQFHIYNAANKQAHYKSGELVGGCCGFPSQPNMEIIQTYDGLGQPASNRHIIRSEVWVEGPSGPDLQAVNTTDDTLYMVRSTVLGGAVIAELVPGAGGQLVKTRINIYGDGNQRIAKEEHSKIVFEHNTPIGSTTFDVGAHSNHREITEIAERDPSGAYISRANPVTDDFLQLGAGRPFQESGNPFDLVDGCSLDQIPIDCSFLDRLMKAGGVKTELLATHQQTYYKPGDPNPYARDRLMYFTGDIFHLGNGIFGLMPLRPSFLDFVPYDPELPRQNDDFLIGGFQRERVTKDQEQILRSDFEKLLLREDGDCLRFARRLLLNAAINTQRPLYNAGFIEDPVRIFDEVLKQGGVVVDPTIRGGGAAEGSLGKDDKLQATILLKRIVWGGLSFPRGEDVFHESAHFAPASGVFSDRELSWAGYQALYSMGYTVLPPPSNPKNETEFSEYLHWQLIFRACNPSQRRK